MEIQFPKYVPAHRILDPAFVSVRLESIDVSVARVTAKREEIEREQNPASLVST